MSHHFLSLSSPHEMFQKAQRELARFRSDPSVDHAFNFFVTVFHIRDYARLGGRDISELDASSDFQLCRLACHTAKHLKLERKDTVAAATQRSFDTHADVAHEGHHEYAVIADGVRIPILDLGHRVLNYLEAWLAKHQ